MKKTFLVLSVLTILLYACKEDSFLSENPITENSTQASQDHLFAENILNDVGRIVEDGFNNNGLSKSSCVNYKSMASDSSDADTLIIDFGDIDCLDEYGRLRKGKVIVIYTAPYRDSFAQITITFDHYYVNSTNWIQGSRTVTNLGMNANNKMLFDIEADIHITTTSGIVDWQTSRTRIWETGINTALNPFDDKYKVVGNASGNGRNGNNFTVTITDTLNVNLGCLQDSITYNEKCVVVSGKVKITPDGNSAREINYGSGECNCNFSVTINGETHLVVVR